jgi:hypothetical protein
LILKTVSVAVVVRALPVRSGPLRHSIGPGHLKRIRVRIAVHGIGGPRLDHQLKLRAVDHAKIWSRTQILEKLMRENLATGDRCQSSTGCSHSNDAQDTPDDHAAISNRVPHVPSLLSGSRTQPIAPQKA